MDEYSSNNIVTENDNVDIIDISKSYNFIEFMDKLKEDNRYVFFSNGQLYFVKNDSLKKTSKGLNDTLTPLCEDVKITTDLMNQKFYSTNILINHIISKIEHTDIIKYLHEGYTLIHIDDDNYYSMTIHMDDDECISYCITDLDDNSLDPDECYEHYELISNILFDSLLNGTWFILDNKEE